MRVLRRWIVTEVLRGTAVVTAVFAALFLFSISWISWRTSGAVPMD